MPSKFRFQPHDYRYFDKSILTYNKNQNLDDYFSIEDVVTKILVDLGCITATVNEDLPDNLLMPLSLFTAKSKNRFNPSLDLVDVIRYVARKNGIVTTGSYSEGFTFRDVEQTYIPVEKLNVDFQTSAGLGVQFTQAAAKLLNNKRRSNAPANNSIDFSDLIGSLAELINLCTPFATVNPVILNTNPGTSVTSNVGINNTLCLGNATTTFAVVGSAANGTIDSFDTSTGAFTFTPIAGLTNTQAGFQYQMFCDGVLQGTSVVTINIGSYTATAVNDNFTTTLNTQLTGDVSLNDTLCNSGVTTFTVNTTPTAGTLVLNTDGTFTYDPLVGFIGSDTFRYDIRCDGNIVSTSALGGIVIETLPFNAFAEDDLITIDPNVIAGGDLSINDTACDNGVTTYQIQSGTELNGTGVVNANGTYTFTPTANLGNSTGGFTYDILCDGNVTSSANLIVTINPYTANGLDIDEATSLDIPYSSTVASGTPCNVGTTTYQINTGPFNGVISGFIAATGAYTYTPNAGYSGTDSFTYDILCDGNVIDTKLVNITISPFSADAVDDSTSTDPVTPISGFLSVNDTACNIGVTTYSIIPGSVINGTVSISDVSTGAYTFTPSAGVQNTNGTFNYAINCDGTQTDTATVTISIGAYTAVAEDDDYTVNVNSLLIDTVSTNDTPCNFGTTEYRALSNPSNGILSVGSSGVFSYMPNLDFQGVDTFTIGIFCDGVQIDTSAHTVNVTLAPSAVIASVPTNLTVDSTGTVGDFVSFTLDVGNTGVVDETIAYVANTGTNIGTFTTTITDGSLISVIAARDALGTDANTATYLIPNSSVTLTTPFDNLSNVVLNFSAVFDSNTTNRNFRLDFKDSTGAIVYTENVTGTTDSYIGYDVNLVTQGVTDFTDVDVTASDEKGTEFTPSTDNRCDNLDVVASGDVFDTIVVTDNGNGTDTWAFNTTFDAPVNLNAAINSVTTNSTDVDYTVSGNFVRLRILDVDGTTEVYNSNYQTP